MKLKIKKKKDSEGTTCFALDGEVTIYTTSKLKDILFNEVKNAPAVKLDLSDMNQIDTSGFQLFLFLKREAVNQKKQLTFINISSKAETIFNMYNEEL